MTSQVKARAGTMRTILSQHKRPDPLEWAKTTTDMIVQAKDNGDWDRKVKIAALRRKVAESFAEVLRSITIVSDPYRCAAVMEGCMIRLANETEWAPKFSDPIAKAAIHDVILRNVTTFISLTRGN